MGTGQLTVTNGGTFTSYGGYIGGYASSGTNGTGTAVVDGSGGNSLASTWSDSSTLIVGVNNTGTLTVSNGGKVLANGQTMYAGEYGSGNGTVVVESGGSLLTGTSYLAYTPGSTGIVTISGANSQWTAGSGVGSTQYLYLGCNSSGADTGAGTLNVVGGGVLNMASMASYHGVLTVGSGSVLSVDVGNNSSVALGTGGTLNNNGAVRVVCGALPAAANTYTPIMAGSSAWAGSGTVQAVGGTWSGGTFTASNSDTGTPGTALTMADQRALWTDVNGNQLGASFLASGNTVTVSALGGTPAPPGLPNNNVVLGDWSLSGMAAGSSNPVYLSLSGNRAAANDTLWCYNGSSWSQLTATPTSTAGFTYAPDLTFDGTYYNFTVTGSGGTGVGFDGYDYAVVGTPKLAADINVDGRVDINDLTIVLANYGQAGKTWTQGSIDGDPTGTVDINDLTIVLANYGATISASAGPGISAVPEPCAFLLLAAGLLGLLAYVWRGWR